MLVPFSCYSVLSIAPDMKIYCFYGTGVPTERSYFYALADEGQEEHNRTNSENDTQKQPRTASEAIYPATKPPNLVR